MRGARSNARPYRDAAVGCDLILLCQRHPQRQSGGLCRHHRALVERPNRRPDHKAQAGETPDVWTSQNRSAASPADRRSLIPAVHHRRCVRAKFERRLTCWRTEKPSTSRSKLALANGIEIRGVSAHSGAGRSRATESHPEIRTKSRKTTPEAVENRETWSKLGQPEISRQNSKSPYAVGRGKDPLDRQTFEGACPRIPQRRCVTPCSGTMVLPSTHARTQPCIAAHGRGDNDRLSPRSHHPSSARLARVSV